MDIWATKPEKIKFAINNNLDLTNNINLWKT
jgi:hypothetical protein